VKAVIPETFLMPGKVTAAHAQLACEFPQREHCHSTTTGKGASIE
jgi:hypothetical protein